MPADAGRIYYMGDDGYVYAQETAEGKAYCIGFLVVLCNYCFFVHTTHVGMNFFLTLHLQLFYV